MQFFLTTVWYITAQKTHGIRLQLFLLILKPVLSVYLVIYLFAYLVINAAPDKAIP